MSRRSRRRLEQNSKNNQDKKNQNNWDLIEKIVIAASLLIYFFIFPPFFKNQALGGHDAGAHLTYLRIFTDALSQGQFPVRWIEWVSGGQNQPLFSFYQPLLYYIAQIPHILGADILNSLYQTVLVLWLFSGLITYLFVKNITKSNLAAGVASALYVFAPYHILDVFVRSALPEATALAFAPGLFWALERYFATNKKHYLGFLALFFSFVFTSHPPTLIMFSLPFLLYFIYLIWQSFIIKSDIKILSKKALFVFLSVVLGGGLSAYFAIPAFLQQNLIHSASLNVGYLSFQNHFVCFLQLLWSDWGYGTSAAGCSDQLSFQVGIVNWFVIIASIFMVLYLFIKKQKSSSNILVSLWIFIALFGMYMTLSISQPFWEGVPYVSFIQFPWRFLSIVIFASAVLSGLLFNYVQKKNYQIILFVLLIVLTPLLVFSYLQPAAYLPKDYFAQDSKDAYSGLAKIQQNSTAELGYMPKSAKVLPIAEQVPTLQIKTLDETAKIAVVKNTFTLKDYVVILPKKSRAILYIHYFPGWKFEVNGKNAKVDYSNIYGLVYLNLPAGQSRLTAKFTNTSIVTFSNLVSLFSYIAVFVLMIGSIRKPVLTSKLPSSREEI